MKKSFFRLVFFILLTALSLPVLFSCSNANQAGEAFDESDTLRFTAEKLYSATSWTEELETDRLTTGAGSVKGISSKLNLSPLIVAASVPSENSAVFPRLENFGSLDTSLIPSSLRTSLNSFCEAVSNNNDSAAETFFKKDSLYSLSLFYVDFKRIFDEPLGISEYEKKLAEWQKEQGETQKKESSEKENKDENSDVKNESTKPEIVFFTDYVLGEPFLDGIYYEVPVLLTGKKAGLTLSLFCFEEAGIWKIDQIQIADWEIF
ncbi:MAG: hypothetical protein II821_06750 [Treponema sp.]|nr:hypothetical protein [Treponema sp.]